MTIRQVVPRDAIPSVDDPEFGRAYDGDDADRVVAVEPEAADEPARAYPVRYLHYHEIVNDDLGTEPGNRHPIAVTWCPLCGSAVVYSRTVGDRTLTFGVSGKLADDDLVLYDRETESEWKQSSGECIAGELAGESLTVLPAGLLPWREFRERHGGRDGDGDYLVLRPPGGESEASGDGSDPEPIDYDEEPYRAYFERDGFGLAAHRDDGDEREWNRDDLDPKTVVLGVERDGEAVGVPLPRVEDAGGVVTTRVGGDDLLVVASDGLHAFEDPGYEFERGDDEALRADGTRWHGATGAGDDGRELDRVPARRLFAFAWQDDHGPDAFWTGDESGGEEGNADDDSRNEFGD